MCRDNNHGGRRCPNDTSEARRLRRANAAAKIKYRNVALPLTEAEYSQAEPIISSSPEIASIETINKKIDELKELKEYQNQLGMRLPNGEYKMPFENHSDRVKALEEMASKFEQKVLEIGAEVNALAQSRTGYSDEAIQEKLLEFQKPLLKKFDELEAERKVLNEALMAKYKNDDYPNATDATPLINAAIRAGNTSAEEDLVELRTLTNKMYEAKSAAASAAQGRVPEVTEMLIANAKEYRNVLSEVRPLGGDIKIADNSASKEGKLMKEVAEIYPTAWIEASNNSNSLRIKKTTRRAHYSHNKEQKTYEVSEKINLYAKPKDWTPDEHDRWESGWTRLPDGVHTYVHPKTGMEYEHYVSGDEAVWVAPRYEYFSTWNHRSKGGVPTGPGWEKVTIRESKYNYETKEHTYELVETYRRVEKRRTRTSWGNIQAELTIDGERSEFGSNGYPTALHEFAHRVERTGPSFIHDMQTEFIRRRTTDSSGVREDKQTIYPKTKERGWFDNFPDKYMGKEYPGTVHHEILSTGVEAVFAGKFGGLVGVGDYKADPEMKNFILGLWAAA